MKTRYAVALAAILSLPTVAQANVFGSVPSAAASARITKCNQISRDAYLIERLHDGFSRASQNGPTLMAQLPERLRAYSRTSGATRLSALNSKSAKDIVGEIRDSLLDAYAKADCGAVYLRHAPGEPMPDAVSASQDWELGLLFGGSTTTNSESAFSPALGISMASNTLVATLAIDPSVIDEGGISVTPQNAEATVGELMLTAQLGKQSLYGGLSWLPYRIGGTAWGLFSRLTVRRLRLDLTLEDGETKQLHAALFAADTGLSFVQSLPLTDGETFSLGAQIGLMTRLLPFETPPGEAIATALGSKSHDSGIYAFGLQGTLFLNFKSVMPYLRASWLFAYSDNVPTTLDHVSAFAGIDLIASLDFSKPD